MKFRGWITVLLVLCLPAAAALGQSGGLSTPDSEKVVRRLGDIMNGIQARHIKLWFAGKAANWELTDYELLQLKADLAEAALNYSGIPISNVTTLATQMHSVADAVAAKDGRAFAKAFGELTDACNNCHQSLGRGFLTIRVPTEQPFSNQVFSLPGKK